MLKGTNRNVMVVHTNKDSRFEAVYFVLKKASDTYKTDIITEANRIISEGNSPRRKRHGRLKLTLLILCSLLLGAAIGVFACLTALL